MFRGEMVYENKKNNPGIFNDSYDYGFNFSLYN